MVLHYDTEPNLFRVQVALEVTKFRERIAKYVAFFRRGAKLCIRMYEYVLAGTFVSTFALRFELRCTVLTHDFAGAFVRAKIIMVAERYGARRDFGLLGLNFGSSGAQALKVCLDFGVLGN